jgi:hypothetical protein
MSKHPYDWIIHAVLCMIPVIFLEPTLYAVITVLFVGILVEYEQKSQIWYTQYTWWEYIRFHAFFDFLADWIGILIGIFIKSL